MCKCLFIEYSCSCREPECPHHSSQHLHYHKHNALFQIDHFKWRYCPRYLALVGILAPSTDESVFSATALDKGPTPENKKTMRSLKDLLTGRLKSQKEAEENNKNTDSKATVGSSRKMETSNNEQAEPVSWWSNSTADESGDQSMEKMGSGGSAVPFPVQPSEDPRHGGEIPECESISYEGWRISRRKCRWCEDYWIGRSGRV